MYLEVPVWRPTMAEFQDFTTFIKSAWEKSVGSGIMKIIPPKEWKVTPETSYEKSIGILIPAPVKQTLNGAKGLFQQSIEEFDSMTVLEFEKKANDFEIENKIDNLTLLEEKEEKFWKTIQYGPNPLYGADMSGTLFEESLKYLFLFLHYSYSFIHILV
jgi:hypothetical protein